MWIRQPAARAQSSFCSPTSTASVVKTLVSSAGGPGVAPRSSRTSDSTTDDLGATLQYAVARLGGTVPVSRVQRLGETASVTCSDWVKQLA